MWPLYACKRGPAAPPAGGAKIVNTELPAHATSRPPQRACSSSQHDPDTLTFFIGTSRLTDSAHTQRKEQGARTKMSGLLETVVPALGALMSTLMYASPIKAVMKAEKDRSLGVRHA